MKTNYHTHTKWCDGSASPREMVEAALTRGFTELGFSSHSEMLKDARAYIADIREVAAQYAGQIRILCGIEADAAVFPAGTTRADYDYAIGSVHFVTAPDGAVVAIDHSPKILFDGIAEHFGGDARALVEAYFAAQIKMLQTGCFEIVGHPDLVRKFNVKHPWLDEGAAWYKGAQEALADAIATSGRLVEINTGAISRGWLDDAYPAAFLRGLLRSRGVEFILSSDAHAPAALDCAFDRFSSIEGLRSSL